MKAANPEAPGLPGDPNFARQFVGLPALPTKPTQAVPTPKPMQPPKYTPGAAELEADRNETANDR